MDHISCSLPGGLILLSADVSSTDFHFLKYLPLLNIITNEIRLKNNGGRAQTERYILMMSYFKTCQNSPFYPLPVHRS